MRNMQNVYNISPICINIHLYADICAICLNMYKEKYAIICKSNMHMHKCARNLQQYMQYQVCKHMCIISSNIQKYAKTKYAHLYKHTICTKYAQNMHKYANPDAHKYAFSIYA